MSIQAHDLAGKPGKGPAFLAVGDSALAVQFGESVDAETNRRVIALAESLTDLPLDGVLECVPTYRSLLVSYDPARLRGAALEAALAQRVAQLQLGDEAARRWRVPVVYGGEVGLDLEDLAREKELTPDELIELHSAAEFRVYMIGFAPGFAYLGGLPEALHTPRLPKPRMSIPAGAIGIGGQQGSINSVTGPSGWRFIGWTPWRAFDPARAEPFLFAAGDRLSFVPVSAVEGAKIEAAIAAGEMLPEAVQ
ncbi:5-oxoprolinase subunit PxpB [Salipiger sp. PrR002]|uniref:5-oxoprolinase subunit PxpB n=1 Tax=Salipiger sp. PrR002 TaxID=2706489 RepID=UPI0013BCCCD1|nr:5-oxoprolinase subunit PxpB [Salipiger sp. PrR002]NDW02646.1 5-oxoprolinase subunit PxpB [Salipiger sp. PrR002]NDW59909.1 5-oxoprolinase subunit PxpB [Salipiger sp. PrR004]